MNGSALCRACRKGGNILKKLLAILFSVLLALLVLGGLAEGEYPRLTGEEGLYRAGEYEQKVRGMGGWMVIHAVFSPDAMESIEVVSHTETPNIGTLAIEKVIPAMLEAQSAEVDGVTGATITSNALKEAVAAILEEAAVPAEEKPLYIPGEYEVKLRGMGGFMTIRFTISDYRIEKMEMISHTETPNIGTLAIEKVIPAMLEAQSSEVDGVTGATTTSDALKEAWKQAVEQAAVPQSLYVPGVYEVQLRGMGGKMTIQVTFSEDKIENFEVLKHTETPNIGTLAIEKVIPAMLEAQSAEVDGVTGATITSDALKEAMRQAIAQAQGK